MNLPGCRPSKPYRCTSAVNQIHWSRRVLKLTVMDVNADESAKRRQVWQSPRACPPTSSSWRRQLMQATHIHSTALQTTRSSTVHATYVTSTSQFSRAHRLCGISLLSLRKRDSPSPSISLNNFPLHLLTVAPIASGRSIKRGNPRRVDEATTGTRPKRGRRRRTLST